MAYSKQAHELLDSAFEVLKTKSQYPYARMVGYLMPNVSLEDAVRISEIILEWEGDK